MKLQGLLTALRQALRGRRVDLFGPPEGPWCVVIDGNRLDKPKIGAKPWQPDALVDEIRCQLNDAPSARRRAAVEQRVAEMLRARFLFEPFSRSIAVDTRSIVEDALTDRNLGPPHPPEPVVIDFDFDPDRTGQIIVRIGDVSHGVVVGAVSRWVRFEWGGITP